MKHTRVFSGFASVALLVFSLVALLPDHAYACSGGGTPLSAQEIAKQELEESRAVFSGKAQDITKLNHEDDQTVTFRTIDVWKGPDRDTLEVTNEIGICGGPLEEGQEYLVYADHSADRGLIIVPFGGTKALSEASEEVQALSLVDTSGIVPGYAALGLASLTATGAFLLMRRLLKIR